jgi:hypothetical protein
VIPSYANIKVPRTSPAQKYTQRKVPIMRIKDEIRYLHIKKQRIYQQLDEALLPITHNRDWQHLKNEIENRLHREISFRYKNLNKKLLHLSQSQTRTPQEKLTFYPRVVNNTTIAFSDNEMSLLQKGPKYNIHAKRHNWIQNLALEAETAITKLPANEREPYRNIVADRIRTLQRNDTTTPKIHHESKLVESINKKLNENNAMIAGADKGNSIVVIQKDHYEDKIQDFLRNQSCTSTTRDPTNSFQAKVTETLKLSKTLIPKDCRWKYTNLNPSAPTLKGLIKLHKAGQPIRPVVNWRGAPAYKLSKLFTQTINNITPLPNALNIRNTTELVADLQKTPMRPHYKLASLDISNLYSNIPIQDTKTILSNILKHSETDPQTQKELLMWYDTITRQNYFAHNHNIMTQQNGLAMGAPSSGLIAEIFLQHTEHKHLPSITQKHKIVNYIRYVDDILMIFDSTHTDVHDILTDFNAIHPHLHFTAETESNNTLNYLDISIHRSPESLKTSIYRKPTFTDTIIPYTSNHPPQHKFAAIKFLFNRLHSYNLAETEHRQELNSIHNIMQNNSFPIPPHEQKPRHTTRKKTSTPPEQKWATFTYVGKETHFITNIFKQTNIQIAFRTKNTIQNLLKPKIPTSDVFSSSGVYKLSCPECNMAYVGQIGRQFSQRYKEHKSAFYNNTPSSSSFARHHLEETHPFGPIHEVMQILQLHKKKPAPQHHRKVPHILRISKRFPPQRRTDHLPQQNL